MIISQYLIVTEVAKYFFIEGEIMFCLHLSWGSLAEHSGFLKPEHSAWANTSMCFLSFSLFTVITIPHKAILTCRKTLADNGKKPQFFNYKSMNNSLYKLLSALVFNYILTSHKNAFEDQPCNKLSTVPTWPEKIWGTPHHLASSWSWTAMCNRHID